VRGACYGRGRGVDGQAVSIYSARRAVVPEIKVMAGESRDSIMLSERVTVDDFESEHFRTQLVERLAWAVGDADAVEQAVRRGDG
jgi:hypothetical protein